jgi:hypothetical protein
MAVQLADEHLHGATLAPVAAHLVGEVAVVVGLQAGEVVVVLVVERQAGAGTADAQLMVEAMGRELPMVVMDLEPHMAAQLRTAAQHPTVEQQHTAAMTVIVPHMVVSAQEVARLLGGAHPEIQLRRQVVYPRRHLAHTTLPHQVAMLLLLLEVTVHTTLPRQAARPWTLLHLVITLLLRLGIRLLVDMDKHPPLHRRRVLGMSQRLHRVAIRGMIREMEV